ncbi:MAG: alpha/beta fold hydrolase [Nakamurella sp.]
MNGSIRSPDGAVLRRAPGSRADANAAVLVLHGGDEEPNTRRIRPWWPPVLRMWGLLPALLRLPARPACYLLRHPVRGWNGGHGPIRDARWALAVLRERHPGRPIAVLGHSMGGRVAAMLAAEPDVGGFVGLAPWLPFGEPIPDLAGRRVMLIHGSADRSIPPAQTRQWAERATADLDRRGLPSAGVSYLQIRGGGHTMLRRFTQWHLLAAAGANEVLRVRTAAAE